MRNRKAVQVSFDKKLLNAGKKHVESYIPSTNFSQFIESLLIRDAIESGWLPKEYMITDKQLSSLGISIDRFKQLGFENQLVMTES